MHQTLMRVGQSFELGQGPLKTEIACHPKQGAKKAVIFLPGENGDIKGFNDKYVKIVDFTRDRLGVAYIRSDNKTSNVEQVPPEIILAE